MDTTNKDLNPILEIDINTINTYISHIIKNLTQASTVFTETLRVSPFMQEVMAFGAVLRKVKESPEMEALEKAYIELRNNISKIDPRIFEHRPLI
jgi:hypothetical protein